MQNTLIALDDNVFVARFGVADGNKAGQQFALVVYHRKVFLVRNHCRDNDIFRNFKEIIVKFSADDNGVFYKKSNRFQKLCGVKTVFLPLVLLLFALRRELSFPLLRVGNDKILFCLGQIIVKAGNGKRCRAQETMAIRFIAAGNIVNLKRNNNSAVQSKEPVNQARKAQIAAAPTHGFFKRDRHKKIFENIRQKFFRGFPAIFLRAPAYSPLSVTIISNSCVSIPTLRQSPALLWSVCRFHQRRIFFAGPIFSKV